MAYHTVVLPGPDPADYPTSDKIRNIVLYCDATGLPGWIVADTDPNANSFYTPFPANRWCKRFSILAPGATAEGVYTNVFNWLLASPNNTAIIDELNSDTKDRIALIAQWLELSGAATWLRWGVHVIRAGSVNPVLFNLQPALGLVFRACGNVAYEAYVKYSTWCDQHPTNVGVRDIWLGQYFQDRMDYFIASRAANAQPGRPLSRISATFGVSDNPGFPPGDIMNCADPALFIDRMFYVWKTRVTGLANLVLTTANGGAGSWKWQVGFITDGSGNAVTSRDDAYEQSWHWYWTHNRTDYRYAPNLPACASCRP